LSWEKPRGSKQTVGVKSHPLGLKQLKPLGMVFLMAMA
jgi:hypothetical protein